MWNYPKLSPRRRSDAAEKRSGHAVIEAALLLPMLVFLFVGVFDMGFYCYALINVENAARVAVEYTSASQLTASDSATACTLALKDLNRVLDLSGVSSCGALPLKVTASKVTGKDGEFASQVSVQFQSSKYIPIPGLLAGRLTLTRVAQMRLRSS
jgi:Flp pilus assembly protein TadG